MVDYWIIKLSIPVLLRVLAKHIRNSIGRLTYIETTRAANLLLGVFVKFRLISFSVHKIRPRTGVPGPVLFMSDIRDDKDRVITLDIFRAVLRIRKEILDDLIKGIESYPFLKEEASIHMFHAWLGLKIADEINPAVYFAFYGRWKHCRSDLSKHKRNIMILSHNEWNSYLFRFIKDEKLMDEVYTGMTFKRRIEQWLLAAAHLMQSVLNLILKSGSIAEQNFSNTGQEHKNILVHYSLGVDLEQRNDIPFVHPDQFDLSRVVFLVKKSNIRPSELELDWFFKNNISCLGGPSFRDSLPGIKQWQSTSLRIKKKKSFCRTYLKMSFWTRSSRNGHAAWLLNKLWMMGMVLAYWYDFLKTNRIGLVLHSSFSAIDFHLGLAISESGGIAVDVERSILYDSCTYIHNSPCHVRFVSGSYSLGQFPEPSFSLFTLKCGVYGVFQSYVAKRSIEKRERKGQILLTVLDEIPNDVFFGGFVEQFYRAVLDLASEDSRIHLQIKTKKPRVLEILPEIRQEIDKLALRRKGFLLDWKEKAATASSRSDLTVCLPSTAAFESLMTGTPTLVFNPMRTGSSIFYKNNGLGRRIFEDRQSLILAIKKYADGCLEAIGECSDILPLLDSFQDGKAAIRVGQYIQSCLEGFDKGWKREKILENANHLYRQQWGEDKISTSFPNLDDNEIIR